MLGTAAQEILLRRFAIAHAFSASLTTAAIGAALASATIHASSELGRRQKLLQQNLAYLDARLHREEPPSNLPILPGEVCVTRMHRCIRIRSRLQRRPNAFSEAFAQRVGTSPTPYTRSG
jgi:hypothetical protein